MSPIHKGGSRGIVQNYRPVALTSHLIKFFEKIPRGHLVTYLEDHNNLFNPEQHGFRLGRSCLSQLITHYDRILHQPETGANVDAIYLDFAKAVDKVDHGLLLHEIHDLGIWGKIGIWLHSFLTDGKQQIAADGTLSQPSNVASGVPQGSVIGPLLFVLRDIDSDVAHCFLSSFADDTRMGKGITCIQDAEMLQEDLNQVYRWAEHNNMEFNASKFELLRYGNDQHLKEITSYTTAAGDEIKEETHVRDLGITMNNKATFKQHIQNVALASSKMAGWILRTFQTRKAAHMTFLWKTLAIPLQEYCCQL